MNHETLIMGRGLTTNYGSCRPVLLFQSLETGYQPFKSRHLFRGNISIHESWIALWSHSTRSKIFSSQGPIHEG